MKDTPETQIITGEETPWIYVRVEEDRSKKVFRFNKALFLGAVAEAVLCLPVILTHELPAELKIGSAIGLAAVALVSAVRRAEARKYLEEIGGFSNFKGPSI